MSTKRQEQANALEASYEEYRNFQLNEFSLGIKVSIGCMIAAFPFLKLFKSTTESLIGSVAFGVAIFLILLLFASYKHYKYCRMLGPEKTTELEVKAQAYPQIHEFVVSQIKRNGHLVRYHAAFVALAIERYGK